MSTGNALCEGKNSSVCIHEHTAFLSINLSLYWPQKMAIQILNQIVPLSVSASLTGQMVVADFLSQETQLSVNRHLSVQLQVPDSFMNTEGPHSVCHTLFVTHISSHTHSVAPGVTWPDSPDLGKAALFIWDLIILQLLFSFYLVFSLWRCSCRIRAEKT